MIGKLKDLMKTRDGDWLVSFTTRVDPRPLFDEFTGKDVNVEIKKASKHRTKTMNDFLWAMCTDIGNAMKPPIPKEDVYKAAIKDVGVFEPQLIRKDAVDHFRNAWGNHGIGWFTEVVDYSPAPGYVTVFSYYGTSTYTVDEMSKVIDYMKQDMTNLGLAIPISKEEEKRLMSNWGKRRSA
jgi:hypothetical protein